MTSSTWSCDPPGSLSGFGADCESIDRFGKLLAREAHPLPSVFTCGEVERARASADPPRGLCACFCAKEAVAKALGALFDLTACELVADAAGSAEIILAPDLMREHGIASARVDIREVEGAPGELVVLAYLYS